MRLDDIIIVCQVACGSDKCQRCGNIHNAVALMPSELDLFCDHYGHGNEDVEMDSCKECGELGVLSDPLPLVYVTALPQSPVNPEVFGINLTVEMIDSLVGALNNYAEGDNKAIVTLTEEAAGFAFEFYLTGIAHWTLKDANKSNTDHAEQNKTIICSPNGICLSVEAEEKVDEVGEPPHAYFAGDAHKNFMSAWMSKADLLVIREWIAGRE